MDLILVTVFAVFLGLTNAQSSCITPSGDNGDCISIYKCGTLIDLVKKKNRTSQDTDLLKKSACGYEGDTQNVCCPKKSTPAQSEDVVCYTPEGKAGKCISIYSCSHLVKMLKPATSRNIDYVQKSRCEGPEKYSVCCGPSPNPTEDVLVGNCEAKMTAFPPDSRSECCGIDAVVPDKTTGYGGNATKIDGHPWVVIIEYVNKEGEIKLLCGGALISGKYLLTAGHCVAGNILKLNKPRTVRLGEYDITHEGPDCVEVDAGDKDCTEGVTRIAIEKTIPHPDYNPADPRKRNDIALIRLKETAPYTDFIRPICLPTMNGTVEYDVSQFKSQFQAVGWGAVSHTQPFSNVKVSVQVPFVSLKDCQPAYKSGGRNVALWKGQLCAGGKEGVDSCKGDSGGPLVYVNQKTHEVVGIISFGPLPCGLDGVPGIYTNVYEYLDWIKSTIVP